MSSSLKTHRNREKRVGKTALSLLAAILVCAATAFLLLFSVDGLDDLILLRNRNPGYWNYLRPTILREHAVLKTTADDPNRTNLLVETASSLSEDSYSVTMNADGSVTFQGKNDTGRRLSIVLSGQELEDGTYYYSDGAEGSADSPSEKGIRTELDGVSYLVGGGRTRNAVVSMPSSGENCIFYADRDEFMRFQTVLIVEENYENQEGISFYPMISAWKETRYSSAFSLNADTDLNEDSGAEENPAPEAERSSDEERVNTDPAALSEEESTDAPDGENSSPESGGLFYTYQLVRMSRSELESLTASDWKIFRNAARGASGLDWTTIDIGSGNGIQASAEGIFYGNINAVGQVVSSPEEVNTFEKMLDVVSRNYAGIEEADPRSIEDFSEYLARIAGKGYSLFLSLCDEGTAALTEDMGNKLSALGLETDFLKRTVQDGRSSNALYRHSYAAVIEGDRILFEGESGEDPVENSGSLSDGTSYTIRSLGYKAIRSHPKDSASRIEVDGLEYCMNRRGMNIVVYDPESHSVIDSVCFDTDRNLEVYRTCGEAAGVPADGN